MGWPHKSSSQSSFTACFPVESFYLTISNADQEPGALQIMATVSDNSIVVWDARSGEQQAQLKGHRGNIHVLEGHPHLLNLLMSASYDGQTIIWDIHSCSQLAWCAPLALPRPGRTERGSRRGRLMQISPGETLSFSQHPDNNLMFN